MKGWQILFISILALDLSNFVQAQMETIEDCERLRVSGFLKESDKCMRKFGGAFGDLWSCMTNSSSPLKPKVWRRR